MEPRILYQDEAVLILDKPAGWVVNDASTTKGVKTVQEWLTQLDFPISKSRDLRSGIVHRLDKETSGILLVAKTPEVFVGLQDQFKNRVVEKVYTALVHGRVFPETGFVEAPVGRLPWNRRRFGVLPGGRTSYTAYKVQGNFEGKFDSKNKELFTLLDLFPKTGRTHQIRIHMKHIGHPLVADDFYAGRKTARHDRKWCSRLFLHAAKITFSHPVSGKRVTFESTLAADLIASLNLLEKSEASN